MKTPSDWLDLLHRCQNGEATCMFVYQAMEEEKKEEARALGQQALELCWQIESLPASEQQTKVSLLASALRSAIVGVPGWLQPETPKTGE